MNLRRIRTLFTRDMRDAIRDGRILVAIVLPIGLVVYFGIALPDPDERPSATLVVATGVEQGLVDAVRGAARDSVELDVKRVDDERAARDEVEDSSSSVGLVAAGEGFELFVRGDVDEGGSILASVTERVSAQGGAPSPVDVKLTVVAPEASGALDVIGLNASFALFGIVMLTGFIALLVIPVLFVEEITLRTLEALQLVATTAEIVLAKVLVGMTYCALSIGLIIALGGLDIEQPVAFVLAALALALAMTGFGLALGLLLGDGGKVNTWSGVVLIPFLIPVFVVLGPEQPWRIAGELLPTGAGTQLLAAALDPSVADPIALPIVVLAAWTIAGFATTWRLLERRAA